MGKEITLKYKIGRIALGVALGVAGIGAIKGLDYYNAKHRDNMPGNAGYLSFDSYGLNQLHAEFKEVQAKHEELMQEYKDLEKITKTFKETMEDLNSSLKETNLNEQNNTVH
ncbi:MAG: hypothetical protein AABW91_03955 [Nanoarchaeota archaeon]